nr:ribonuclease H-like domain-containing protein [Tanacetum cinerariifolium]
DIWNAIKARFGENAESKKMQNSLLKKKFEEFKISEEEGLDKGYDKMQKILSQMNTLKIKPEPEDVNMKFLRGLPPSWNQEMVAMVAILPLSAFPSSSSSKGSSKSKCSFVDDVIYSFFANHEIDQQLVYKDLDQMNKEEFEEENARFDKKLVKCFNCKQMGHFSRECRAQGGQNSNNYQKYKSKEAGKDGSDSKAMVVVDDDDSEGEVVFVADIIPAGVSVPAGTVTAVVVSAQSETEFVLMGLSTELAYEEKIRVLSYELEEKSNILEYRQKLIDQAEHEKQELMTKLDNEIANQAKWNNSGKNLYKLIDSSMFVRTKRGLGLDKYIGEGELGIDDSQFSIFYTNSDELEGQPIYNWFASVAHMKAVPPPLTRNYMPPSNIPDIDESQMVYGKKATDSSEIKTTDDSITHTNDSVLFDFSDRSSEPSTNDLKMYDSSMECSRPNHSDHDYTSSISAPASKFSNTIVIDCDKQEDFPSVCSIKTDVKSSKPFYLHLIKDCDFHEQTFTKRNAEGKGISGRRPTGKPVNPNRPKPVYAGLPNPVSAGYENIISAGQPNLVSTRQQNTVSAGQPNPVSAGQQNTVSVGLPNPIYAGQPNPVYAGDGILGPRPLNIQSTSTYFHSFTHNNQQITHNSLYSLYMTGGLNGKTVVKPSACWPWTKYGMSKTKGSKIIGGSKSKSWSYAKGPLGNKDKLEDFEDFDGGEVTFGGSTGKILGKGTIKTNNLNFENVLYVEELQYFNLISVSQICDQTHRVLFTGNECLVLSKDFPLPDPSMVILSTLRKHNLYTFSLNELTPKGPLTCLIAKASHNESTLWHRRLGNMNKLVKGNLVRGLPSKVF